MKAVYACSCGLLLRMGRWALGLAVGVLGVALFSPAAWASLDIPVGTHSVVFQDGRGRPDRPITVHTHRPAPCVAAACPILVVMHGNTRNAAAYRDHWVPWADTLGLMVLAPEFNRRDWPGSRSYNQGDMAAQADPAMWSYSVVEHLFDAVRTTQAHYLIFGHSAGAQFVHRLLMALPNNRARLAMIANAGWYTLPEWREGRAAYPWPHSLLRARVGEAGATALLRKPVWLLLGESDTGTRDADLDQAPGSQAQGPNRLSRGLYYLDQVQGLARELQSPWPWTLIRVPGVGHDAKGMTDAAARELQRELQR